MSKFIIRLDDACERRDREKWDRMEKLLDSYGIKSLVGVIPHCEDSAMAHYEYDGSFWERVHKWVSKGWTIALHGYNHVYTTNDGGINPVNARSEFAGETIDVQREKIKSGLAIMQSHGITPEVFFAPSHTFDENTIKALKEESEIRIISDTIAADIYSEYGMTFVPQQSGRVRKLPFRTVTFCYHPNTMSENDFETLEVFLRKHRKKFIAFPISECSKKKTLFDKALSFLYFVRR